MHVAHLIIISAMISLRSASARTMGDLSDHLLDKHRSTRFPENLVVSVDAAIYQLMDVDGANQAFSVLLWMSYVWKDTSLSWDISQFNYSACWLPVSEVWKPDIVVFNIVSFEQMMDSTTPYVTVRNDGTVSHSFPMIYTVSCTLEIRMFPFDKQTCIVSLGSWVINAAYLNLTTLSDKVDTYAVVPNKQWILEKTEANRVVESSINTILNITEMFTSVNFVFHLTRRSMYHVFNLIIPVILITTISLLGIFMPSESGGSRTEKVTMGLTTMLTMAVFLLMVSDQTPKDSTNMPLISLYIMIDMALITFATMVSIWIMELEIQDLQKVPVPMRWETVLVKLSTSIKKKCGKSMKNVTSVSVTKVRPLNGGGEEVNQFQINTCTLSWRDVCAALDELLLKAHILIFGIITFIMIIILPIAY